MRWAWSISCIHAGRNSSESRGESEKRESGLFGTSRKLRIEDAMDAVPQRYRVEVHDEAQLFVSKPKLGQELGKMHRVQLLDGLELNHDAAIHEEIKTE